MAQKPSFENNNLSEILYLHEKTDTDHLGFDAGNRDAPAYRAFGAGMWVGVQTLKIRTPEVSRSPKTVAPAFLSPGWPDNPETEPDKWAEMPEWAAYFEMGRWCFLLQVICLSGTEMTDEFWKEQRYILHQIQKDFTEHARKTEEDAMFVNDRLRKISAVLENPEWDSSPSKRAQDHGRGGWRPQISSGTPI